jgi:hypothetical protein
MGTGLEVWKKTDGTEVLFTNSYKYDEVSNSDQYEYDGFNHLGSKSKHDGCVLICQYLKNTMKRYQNYQKKVILMMM